jgi:hypothetical protein
MAAMTHSSDNRKLIWPEGWIVDYGYYQTGGGRGVWIGGGLKKYI